jgi:hypothetical protein
MWRKFWTWLKDKVWPWLKKWWKWMLFPIGILLFILSLRRRTTTVVVSDGHATDLAIKKHDEQIAQQVTEAEAKAAAELKKIEEQHAATIESLNAAQRLKYEELKQQGPREINAWLLRVGRGEA